MTFQKSPALPYAVEYPRLPWGKKGFTMIELAVVLVIIGVVVSMAVTSGVSLIATARINATNQKMAAIDQALMAFRLANDRLPCPASLTIAPTVTNYGVEAANPGSCTGGSPAANFYANNTGSGVGAVEGAVPAVTLGLPSDFMYDGWGNRIRYAVDAGMTVTGSFIGTQLGAVCGAITINTGPNFPANTARSSGAIYALISQGPDQHGAYGQSGTLQSTGSLNTDEQTNCHCTSAGVVSSNPLSAPLTFVQESPNVPSANIGNLKYYFDDIVTYKERWQMQAAWDTSGTACPSVWVADSVNNRVQQFDMRGNYMNQFASLNAPKGVFVDNEGYVWVSDTGKHRIQKLDSSGNNVGYVGAGYNNVTGTAGTSGTGNGQLKSPGGIAVDASGCLWVADTSNHRIQKFDPSLNFLFAVPSSGTTASYTTGKFSGPSSLSVDYNGNVWVADSGNNRIQEFDAYGNYITQIANCATPNASVPYCTSSGANGQFNNPTAVSLDASGNVWVSDTGNNRVQQFTNTGTYIYNYTGTNTGPKGVTVDSSGNIWIADTGNNRIRKCPTTGGVCNYSYGTSGSANGQFNTPLQISVTAR